PYTTLFRSVEHVRMRLLDLVEQHDRVRAPADRFGQLAALLIADVAGWGTDQAGNAVFLLVLAHVDADHRTLVVEQHLGEGLCELGLADPGGAEEQERADRPVGVRQPRPAPAYGVRDGPHCLVLAAHP